MRLLARFLLVAVAAASTLFAQPGLCLEPVVPPEFVTHATFVNAPTPTETACLAEAIYFEARGQSRRGQLAVANVVMNRYRTWGRYATVCDVVHDRNAHGCAFTWVCASRPHITDRQTWFRTVQLAYDVLFRFNYGLDDDVTHGATFFHTVDVRPLWVDDPGMHQTVSVENHVFYKRV